jgi:hypothetical protein
MPGSCCFLASLCLLADVGFVSKTGSFFATFFPLLLHHSMDTSVSGLERVFLSREIKDPRLIWPRNSPTHARLGVFLNTGYCKFLWITFPSQALFQMPTLHRRIPGSGDKCWFQHRSKKMSQSGEGLPWRGIEMLFQVYAKLWERFKVDVNLRESKCARIHASN